MNPYEVLEVDEKADNDTIKQAYRKMIKEHHPDCGGTGNISEIKNAYMILSDPEKRQKYDNGEEIDEEIDIAHRAKIELMNLFEFYLDAPGSILEHAYNNIEMEMEKMLGTLSRIDLDIYNLSKKRGRIVCNGNENMFEAVLNNKISELKKMRIDAQEHCRFIELIKIEISKYSEAPKTPKAPKRKKRK